MNAHLLSSPISVPLGREAVPKRVLHATSAALIGCAESHAALLSGPALALINSASADGTFATRFSLLNDVAVPVTRECILKHQRNLSLCFNPSHALFHPMFGPLFICELVSVRFSANALIHVIYLARERHVICLSTDLRSSFLVLLSHGALAMHFARLSAASRSKSMFAEYAAETPIGQSHPSLYLYHLNALRE